MKEQSKPSRALTAEEKAEKQALAEMNENDKLIGHAWAALNCPPIDLEDVPAVEARVMSYLNSCRLTGAKITPPGLAAWLGITSADLGEWLTKIGTEEHRKTAARIYQMLHQSLIDNALTGKVSAQLTMFLAKNWFGYTDAQRIETQTIVEHRKSLDELAKEAAALPDGDVIDVAFKEVRGKKRGRKE